MLDIFSLTELGNLPSSDSIAQTALSRYLVLAEAGLQVVPSFNIKSSPSVCQAFQMALGLHSHHDVTFEGSRRDPSFSDVHEVTELGRRVRQEQVRCKTFLRKEV